MKTCPERFGQLPLSELMMVELFQLAAVAHCVTMTTSDRIQEMRLVVSEFPE